MTETCQDPPFGELLEMLRFEYVPAQHQPRAPPSPDQSQAKPPAAFPSHASPMELPGTPAWALCGASQKHGRKTRDMLSPHCVSCGGICIAEVWLVTVFSGSVCCCYFSTSETRRKRNPEALPPAEMFALTQFGSCGAKATSLPPVAPLLLLLCERVPALEPDRTIQ